MYHHCHHFPPHFLKKNKYSGISQILAVSPYIYMYSYLPPNITQSFYFSPVFFMFFFSPKQRKIYRKTVSLLKKKLPDFYCKCCTTLYQLPILLSIFISKQISSTVTIRCIFGSSGFHLPFFKIIYIFLNILQLTPDFTKTIR